MARADGRREAEAASGSHPSPGTVERSLRKGRAWGTAWGVLVTVTALVILAAIAWVVLF